MPNLLSISPYPVSALPSLPQKALRPLLALQHEGSVVALARRFAEELERWSQKPTSITLQQISPSDDEPLEPRPRLLLRRSTAPLSLLLCLDPRLCLAVTKHLAQGDDEPLDPLPPIEAPLLGAVAALVSHLVDQVGLESPLRIGWGHLPESLGQRLRLEWTLHWGSGAYELVTVVDLPYQPHREPARPVDLTRLGDLPLSLDLVIGECVLTTAELGRLRPSAVFLPGPDLWMDAEGSGRGKLSVPNGEWAYPCELVGNRSIMLGPRAVRSDQDFGDSTPPKACDPVPESQSGYRGIYDVLAEAPLAAQIVLGQVTLPAKQFAALCPGDIVETGCRIGEPVLLRLGGRTIATCELVNIEGQLGLRIRELFTGETR